MQKKNSTRWNTAHALLIIACLAVALAEVAFIVRVVRQRGVFDYVGLDYRGTRAAGEAIAEHGFAAAYDLGLLEASQRRLFDRYTIESKQHGLPFYVIPAPYPPPFTLAFIPSTWLPPVPGFLAWTLIHAIILAVYQLRLAKAFGVPDPGLLIVAVSLSAPAFTNLIMGQISVWLVVFFGEALIAFDQGHRFRSGIWLGLLVCKPQVLVLIIPALALARRWRMLAGMGASVVALIVPTVVLSGDWVPMFLGGIVDFAGSTGQLMNVFPSSMTNWRAFALNATRFYPFPLVAGFSFFAILATGIAGLSCSRGLRTTDRRQSSLAWLGLAAATCAFSWHSHIHQLLLLLAPLYLVVAVWPQLRDLVAGVFLATSTLFLLAAFTLTVGHAHNLLGTTLLAGLVSISAFCSLGLRPGSKILL
jgi:hypothetical protein